MKITTPHAPFSVSSTMPTQQEVDYGYIGSGVSILSINEAIAQGKGRSLEYCNGPATIAWGSEGQVPNHYHLISVHVVIRHGARASLGTKPGLRKDVLDCNFLQVVQNDSLAMAFYNTMTDWKKPVNGGKTPKISSLLPLQAECSASQLTAIGALQHLKLGEHLKHVYVDKLGLFGDRVDKEEVYVRTTEYYRTRQSANAFLFGFLHNSSAEILKSNTLMGIFHRERGNFHWDYTKNLYHCSSSLLHLQCNCPRIYEHIKLSDRQFNQLSENSTLLHKLNKQIHLLLNTSKQIPYIESLRDALMAAVCNGKQLSCSINAPHNCFSWPIVHGMWTLLDGLRRKQFTSSLSQQLSSLIMHPLLKEMVNRMQSISQGKSDVKFVLYSGHDKTVTPLANVLGIYNGKHPPFGSRIIVELYKSSRTSVAYFFRVLYNGEDKTMMVKFCKGSDVVDGLCPLENFVDFVTHQLLQTYGKNSYADACAL
jgi:hypothetical protein